MGKLELDSQPPPSHMRRTLNRLADATIDAGTFSLLRHEADRTAEETWVAIVRPSPICCPPAPLLDQTNDLDHKTS